MNWQHCDYISLIDLDHVKIMLNYPQSGHRSSFWSLVMLWKDGRVAHSTSTIWKRRYSETLEDALVIANKILEVELGK
jgi:hypothetical protein